MSAEEPTLAELLTAVDAAIYSLLTRKVKSYSVGGQSYTYHDLGELREMRRQLQIETRSNSNTIRLADFSGE